MNKNKPYQALVDYYEAKYHHKVAKIALNARFTCPNKDGTKGFGGCSYCSKLGSGDTAGTARLSLQEQFFEIKTKIDKKWPNAYYIPYLEANSNTYAPISILKEVYEAILSIDEKNIIGLAIATRADCFNKDIYDYLKELNNRIPITIELGLQTSNEKTAKRINRCSTNQELISCVYELRKRGIEVVIHIINGLPKETKKDMLNTISFINTLDIQGIKFHNLLLLYDTALYQKYKIEPFHLLTLPEYVEIVAEQIALLKPNIIIHRLAADAPKGSIFAPLWSLNKKVVINEIDKYLRNNQLYQGKHFIQSIQHH